MEINLITEGPGHMGILQTRMIEIKADIIDTCDGWDFESLSISVLYDADKKYHIMAREMSKKFVKKYFLDKKWFWDTMENEIKSKAEEMAYPY